MDKFKKIKEFEPGMIFGELALLYNSGRMMSIAATHSCTCLTIHKNDYIQYLNKYAKRQRDQIQEFFKSVPFLSGLSSQTIGKMEFAFKHCKMEKAGHFVLREGDPVTHIALVKNGEFEIVKRNLKGLDERIMGFLKKGDMRKKVARQVMLLPGRTSVYQKTNKLYPVH